MGRVEGKVAIVTGSASGIGRTTAETLAREGARVVVADIDADGGRAVADGITAAGGNALAVTVDLTVESQVEALVDATVAAYAGLHILHNNAAITSPAHQRRDASLLDMDAHVWDATFAVNLRGAMLACKHAVPHIIASGGGSIVNTTSNAALAGDLTLSAYAASKGGLNALTRSVATAFGKDGVRCNAVSPAHIESPSLLANLDPEIVEMMRDQVLTPRLGTLEDVAQLVLFLASDASSFITGQVIRVDGGVLSKQGHVPELRRRGLTTNRT